MITLNLSQSLTDSELAELTRQASDQGFTNVKDYLESKIAELIALDTPEDEQPEKEAA